MPKGGKTDQIYQALLDKGYSRASAAKIAQHQTGLPLRGKAAREGIRSRIGGRKWNR